jgi:hypothetical protein
MTQAQKTAKAKFKQAIAYRTKTGVSLKEAFAHIYGKKKIAKKVVRKKAAKKRIYGPKDSASVKKELARKGLKMPHGYTTTKRKRISGVKKKKPSEKAVLKSIQHAVKVQKTHMGAIGSAAIDRIKTNMSHLSHYDHAHKKYMSMPLRERKEHNAAIKKLKHLIKETKTHITQLKKSI